MEENDVWIGPFFIKGGSFWDEIGVPMCISLFLFGLILYGLG